MPPVDIKVSANLQQALDLPPCASVKLPKPDPLKLRLPTGGTINALQDMSRGVPTDCSMSFSLVMQIAPFLASIECPLKMLKLLSPLTEIISGLASVPPSPPSAELMFEFANAVKDLAPCFALVTGPAAMIPLICDLLNLVSKILHCLVSQLESVSSLARGLSLQLQAAADNPDLLAQLQCAQENANASAGSLANSIEPISAVLKLASPLFAIAGVQEISLQPPGGAATADSLDPIIQTLKDVLVTIDEVRGAVCP